ncbi:hypothetical protein BDZ89DRAFT_1146655 [Hymenopellis radicata]|nr:hypothetical protein BDZ89DRAFT_1146655 [Hymenopellis radicata]
MPQLPLKVVSLAAGDSDLSEDVILNGKALVNAAASSVSREPEQADKEQGCTTSRTCIFFPAVDTAIIMTLRDINPISSYLRFTRTLDDVGAFPLHPLDAPDLRHHDHDLNNHASNCYDGHNDPLILSNNAATTMPSITTATSPSTAIETTTTIATATTPSTATATTPSTATATMPSTATATTPSTATATTPSTATVTPPSTAPRPKRCHDHNDPMATTILRLHDYKDSATARPRR